MNDNNDWIVVDPDYKGYEIALAPKSWLFFAKKGEEVIQRHSRRDLLEAVEQAVKDAEKVARATWPKHDVLTSEGKLAQTRGIHKASGHLLFQPAQEPDHVFPPGFDWIKELVEERNVCFKRYQEIDRVLYPVRLNGRRAYGRTAMVEMIEKYEEFGAELKRKTELAAKGPGAKP